MSVRGGGSIMMCPVIRNVKTVLLSVSGDLQLAAALRVKHHNSSQPHALPAL